MNKSTNPNHNNNEKSETPVTSYPEELNLLQILVETLAERHCDIAHGFQQVQDGWQAIETNSIEAMASGNVIYADENHLIRTASGLVSYLHVLKEQRKSMISNGAVRYPDPDSLIC